jgi:hypothetical protein
MGALGTHHDITVNGLISDTIYYYQTYAVNGLYTGLYSTIRSFKTPPLVDTNTINGTITVT